ncbi:MAG: DUF4384 domain-containing protein [Deltaproteobacteria bacterium]|nr:DUF4384 domain-containing protein [Deltaproteobacteria bacterium]
MKNNGHRLNECLSDIVLDRIVAGDYQQALHAEHLNVCHTCQMRLRLFQDEHDTEQAHIAQLIHVAQQYRFKRQQRNKIWRWVELPKLLMASAAVAACVLLIMFTHHDDLLNKSQNTNAIRIKGTNLRFFVQRQGEVLKGRSGDAYQTDDALRFVVSNNQPSFFFLVGVEESGKVTAYYPYHGEQSIKLEAGVDMPLPGSLVLDTSQETEYYIGIFTDKALDFASIEQAVQAVNYKVYSMEEGLKTIDLPGVHHLIIVRRE